MSQGEDAYLVLRGVFHVSPPALGGLSIDGKLTFSNNAYVKLTTEWIMLHGELISVVDRTGLPGRFDIELEYAPPSNVPEQPDRVANADRVSIFTALQEQLGLRLQSEDMPMEVLVVDELQRPSEN